MDRRRFLRVTGTVLGSTAIAGCAGSSGDDEPSPQSTPATERSPNPVLQTPEPTPSQTADPTRDRTPTPDPGDTFSSRITVRGSDYYRLGLEQELETTLTWTAEITDETPAPFDVFLFTGDQYEAYQQSVSGSDGSLSFIKEGTTQGIQTSATRTVTLGPGTYSLVVDNTNLGSVTGRDAADRLEITLDAETQPVKSRS